MSYAFDEAIAVRHAPTPDRPGRYSGTLLPGWRIGAVPHGGYLISVILNACVTHSRQQHAKLDQPDPIHLSLAFVVKAQLGECLVDVEPVKIGRSYSNYHVTLSQRDGGGNDDDGKSGGAEVVCVRGYCIVGNLTKESGLDKIITHREPLPAIETCSLVPPFNPGFRHVEQNFEEFGDAGMLADVENECRWIRFKRECDIPPSSRPPSSGAVKADDTRRRPMDTLALGLINDLMMPLPIRAKLVKSGWFPTLVIDLQFKKPLRQIAAARDRAGSKDEDDEIDRWCYLRSETETIAGGRFDISTRCYDGRGDLVVVSRHAALIVDASRNLSKRTARGKI